MNHYEVYYNISKTVLPEDQLKVPFEGEKAALERRLYEKAVRNEPKEGEPFCHYRPNCERSVCNFVVCKICVPHTKTIVMLSRKANIFTTRLFNELNPAICIKFRRIKCVLELCIFFFWYTSS